MIMQKHSAIVVILVFQKFITIVVGIISGENVSDEEYKDGKVSIRKCERFSTNLVNFNLSLEFAYLYNGGQVTQANNSWEISVVLSSTTPKCANGKIVQMDLKKRNLIDKYTQTYFTPTGFLFHQNEVYHEEEFCLLEINKFSHSISLSLCQPTCGKSNKTLCVNKCCGPMEVLDMENDFTCAYSGGKVWTPRLYKTFQHVLPHNTEKKIHLRIHTLSENQNCTEILHPNRGFEKKEQKPFRIFQDGSLYAYTRRQIWMKIHPDQLCVDGIQNFGDGEYFSGSEVDEILIFCLPANVIPEKRIFLWEKIRVICTFVSSGFLLVTAIVLVVLFEKKNHRSWIVLCQIIFNFLSYFLLGVSHSTVLYTTFTGTRFCTGIGICLHFSVLGTFFSLFVIDVDVWRTFRSVRGMTRKRHNWQTTFAYGLIGIGAPFIIVSISVVLDIVYKNSQQIDIIVPRYSEECYVSRAAIGYYSYYIIGILLISNLVFFGLTLRNICGLKVDTGILQKNTEHESIMKLFSKLFIVMGVNWIFEVMSWAHSQSSNNPTLSHVGIMFAIFDLINFLSPVAIFVIFVCNKKSLKHLSLKFPIIKRILSLCIDTSTYIAATSLEMSKTKLSTIRRESSLYSHQETIRRYNEKGTEMK